MKSIRIVLAGLGLLAALPAAATAQDSRPFDNSWFWGVKGGALTFWTNRVQHAPAPLVGIDWLITRHRGGLLLSAEQGFFDEKSSIFDPSAAGQQRDVNISDVRRFNFTLLGFPSPHGALRPYAGAGFSMNVIERAEAVGVTAGTAQADTVASRIEDVRTSFVPHLMLGLQTNVRRFAIFGQTSVMFGEKRSLFNNNHTYILEGGIRSNFGTSIDRDN